MRKMLPGVGVFGTTAVIRCVVPILKSCGFNVVSLWGCTTEEAASLAKELGIPHSTNKVDEVLLHKDVHLVVISCSPHLQAPIVVKALRIGKHVLCGSPSGPGEREALHMVNAARYYPRLMSLMCHGLRFLPVLSKMKTFIEDGYVGDVTICEVKVHYGAYPREKFDWQCDELMGGGVLNAMGSNIIDIITFLTLQKAVKVHGMLKTYTKQTEKIKGIREITSDDFCSFQMDMDGGASTSVTINSHMPGQFTQEIIVIGTKGRLVARGADLFGQKHDKFKEDLLHFDRGNIKEENRFSISDQTRRELPGPYLKGMIRLVEGIKDAFDREEERQSWCSDPLQLAATFEDSFYIQTVVDAIRKSSKQKEWVKVVMITEDPEPNPYLSAAMRRSTFSLQ